MRSRFHKASSALCYVISLLLPAVESKLHIWMALATPQIKDKQYFYDAFDLFTKNMFTYQIIMQYSSRPI